ncbi:MAG: hypothetical protein R6U13_03800 [Desulfatiglandaceae bacterium]
MGELRLISNQKRQLKPLVEAAINNELRLLDAGIHRTEQSLRLFEKKFSLTTDEFINRFENDEMEENLEYVEWIGEFRMLERLKEKAETLRGIRFEN